MNQSSTFPNLVDPLWACAMRPGWGGGEENNKKILYSDGEMGTENLRVGHLEDKYCVTDRGPAWQAKEVWRLSSENK